MQSEARTVKAYLEELSDDRRKSIAAVRKLIRKELPKGYKEVMRWGMITYEVPLKRYPTTYNKQPLMYAALASQKNHMAVYLTSVYQDQEVADWFVGRFKQAGKKLDMGKSCVRFKKLDDLPLDLVAEVIARTPVDDFIAQYEHAISQRPGKKNGKSPGKTAGKK